MSEWQPIETAPKDGTLVVIWHVGIDAAVAGSWRKSRRKPDGPERWRPYPTGYYDQELLAARHWMPQLAPPK